MLQWQDGCAFCGTNMKNAGAECPSKDANLGAFIVRIGFGAHYTIIIIRSPHNIIGRYEGPYINPSVSRLEASC